MRNTQGFTCLQYVGEDQVAIQVCDKNIVGDVVADQVSDMFDLMEFRLKEETDAAVEAAAAADAACGCQVASCLNGKMKHVDEAIFTVALIICMLVVEQLAVNKYFSLSLSLRFP